MTTNEYINICKRLRNKDKTAVAEFEEILKPILTQTAKIERLRRRAQTEQKKPLDSNEIDDFAIYCQHDFMIDERQQALFLDVATPTQDWKAVQQALIQLVTRIYYFWQGQRGQKEYFGALAFEYEHYVRKWIMKHHGDFSGDEIDGFMRQLVIDLSRTGKPESYIAFPSYLITCVKNIIFHYLENKCFYRVSEETLADLAENGVPTSVLENLKNVRRKDYKRRAFLLNVEKKIGAAAFARHKVIILRYCRQRLDAICPPAPKPAAPPIDLQYRIAECLRQADEICYPILLFILADVVGDFSSFARQAAHLKNTRAEHDFYEKYFHCDQETFEKRLEICLKKLQKCVKQEKN